MDLWLLCPLVQDPAHPFVSVDECLPHRAPTWIYCPGSFQETGEGGKLAQQISNASFATISLIYSFTETLDLSDKIASLAGLTARVSAAQKASLMSKFLHRIDVVDNLSPGGIPPSFHIVAPTKRMTERHAYRYKSVIRCLPILLHPLDCTTCDLMA